MYREQTHRKQESKDQLYGIKKNAREKRMNGSNIQRSNVQETAMQGSNVRGTRGQGIYVLGTKAKAL